MEDEAPSVQIVAAEARGRYGNKAETTKALNLLMQYSDITKTDVFLGMAALNAIDSMGKRAMPMAARLKATPQSNPNLKVIQANVYAAYVKNLLSHIK